MGLFSTIYASAQKTVLPLFQLRLLGLAEVISSEDKADQTAQKTQLASGLPRDCVTAKFRR
jgi:hypothetical protein